jgi:hypothetical protein
MSLVEMRLDVPLELFHQKGNALRAATLVSHRIFDDNLVENRAVVQLDEESVSDGARRRLVVGDREVRVLHAVNLGAQRVDTGVRGGGVAVGVRGEFAEDEGVCNHVADRVAFGETCVSDFSKTKEFGGTYSRSAKLSKGPCLSMMRMAASWVRMRTLLMSSEDLPMALSWLWMVYAASTAVWAWNSAGYEILKRTFSMM